MSSDKRSDFFAWYRDKVDRGEQFDFQKEIVEYCQSDVHILRNACLRFREIILGITRKQEVHFDDNEGVLRHKNHGWYWPISTHDFGIVVYENFQKQIPTGELEN